MEKELWHGKLKWYGGDPVLNAFDGVMSV